MASVSPAIQPSGTTASGIGFTFGGSAQTGAIQAALVEADFTQQDQEDGEPYAESESRPAPGYQVIFSYEQEEALKNILRLIGLGNFADVLRFDVFKEKAQRRQMVYAPLRYNLAIQTPLNLLRLAKERVDKIPNHPLSKVLGYILDHVNPNAGANMIYLFPRIEVWDLFAEGVQGRMAQTLHDLNPAELQPAIMELGRHTGVPNLWEEMFQEVPDATRAPTRKVMDAMVAQSRTTPQPAENYTAALEFVEDGALHEFAHVLSVYVTPELAQRLVVTFNRAPFNVLSVKNMGKALLDIRKYRLARGMVPDDRTDSLRRWKYIDEMYADYFAIFLKEKAGKQNPGLKPHFYTRVYKIQIPDILRPIFEDFYAQLSQLDKEQMSYLISQESLNKSPLMNALSVDAALGTVTPYRALWFRLTGIQWLQIACSCTRTMRDRLARFFRRPPVLDG